MLYICVSLLTKRTTAMIIKTTYNFDIVMTTAQLVVFAHENSNSEFCLFHSGNVDADPNEYANVTDFISNIMERHNDGFKFNVGVRAEDTHDYFCVNKID